MLWYFYVRKLLRYYVFTLYITILLYLYLILTIWFSGAQSSIIVIEFQKVLLKIGLLIKWIWCIKATSWWNLTHVQTLLFPTRLILTISIDILIRIDALEIILTLTSLHLNIFDCFRFNLFLIFSFDFFIGWNVDSNTSTRDTAIIFLIFDLLISFINWGGLIIVITGLLA